MNCEAGFLHGFGAGRCLRIRGELAIGGAFSCHRLHMRGGPVKGSPRLTTRDLVTSLVLRPSRSSFFCFH
jgi:hypothetical protein